MVCLDARPDRRPPRRGAAPAPAMDEAARAQSHRHPARLPPVRLAREGRPARRRERRLRSLDARIGMARLAWGLLPLLAALALPGCNRDEIPEAKQARKIQAEPEPE